MENNRKDDMKMRILSFIIGVLVGAIISTSAFIISVNVLGANKSSNGQSSQMQGGGTPPEMPSGENGQGGQPPAMPGESSSQNSNES
ncbi:hypothetical protein IJV57_04355 [Candidatus Saccharibacteria bacterium]|nr:hypothetical protein [Candidatus Saccharibacteria bacterium]